MPKLVYLALALLSWGFQCRPSTGEAALALPRVPKTDMMCGLNFVAPPEVFAENPMPAVQGVKADWIATIPYAFTRQNEANVYFGGEWQWWGERPEGVQRTIELAQAADIKVVLKPQVYIPGGWTGDLDFKTDREWEQWEKDYEHYIMTFIEMADSMEVAAFCVGTEFKIAARKRESFWRGLIKRIRAKYKGKLIYAANWDEYEDMPFWDALDMVGINAYFPLSQTSTPSVDELQKAWTPYQNAIRKFYKRVGKPIVFTEYGYLSVDGCAYNTWELEGRVQRMPINEQAQANALDALLSTFWDEPYWQGGFVWKWFPNMRGGEGYDQRDYSPQGKLGAKILEKWYSKPILTK